jgi:hypothetical protein
MSKSSVFCIAKSASQAEQIVEDLQSSGFDTSEISVLMPDTGGKHDFGHVKATKAPEGATTGATAGGVIGLGIPEIEAKRYEQKLRAGNYLVAVDARDSDEVDRAKEIFKNVGAEDIATSSLSKTPRSAASTRVSETRVTEHSPL